jgi:hypothetical protein
MVVTCSVVVEVMCWPAIAAVRTLLGLLTICWVMPVSPAPEVRKLVWLVRVCSGKSIVWVGGPPIPNGLMPLTAMFGPPFVVTAVPWSSATVPCGMEASRTTVGTTCGSVVAGTAAQMPGSMCSPAPTFLSLIWFR